MDFKRFHKSLVLQNKKWDNKCNKKIRTHIKLHTHTLVAMFIKDKTFPKDVHFSTVWLQRFSDATYFQFRSFALALSFATNDRGMIEARDFEIGQAYDSREDFHIRSVYFDKRKIFVTLLYVPCIERGPLTSVLYSFCQFFDISTFMS